MFRFSVMSFIFLLVCSIGCSRAPSEPDYAKDVKNVIFVVLDTFRANHLGFMGYDRDTSPALDKFSKKCIVFDNAYTPKSLTLPSFTCMWTGLHTKNNGIFQNAWPLDESLHSMVEDFRDAGFKTIGIPSSMILDSDLGIARGFDVYNEPVNPPRLGREGLDAMYSEVNDVDGPMFLFMHFWETHSPYTPAEDFMSMFADPNYSGPMDGSVETLNGYNLGQIQLNEADIQHAIDRYDGEIRELDDHLKELFGYFENMGFMDNSIIAVTADHGESLGEGHFFQHLRDSEVELHIPLMIHFPVDLGAGTRIDALVEITDVMPTIMDILDMPGPDKIDGRSLLPLIEGKLETIHDQLISVGAKQGDKYLFSSWDGENRTQIDIAAMPDTHDLDPETLEQLRALGYIN